MSATTRAGAEKNTTRGVAWLCQDYFGAKAGRGKGKGQGNQRSHTIVIDSDAIRTKSRPEGIATLSDGNLPSSSQNDKGSGEAGSSR